MKKNIQLKKEEEHIPSIDKCFKDFENMFGGSIFGGKK